MKLSALSRIFQGVFILIILPCAAAQQVGSYSDGPGNTPGQIQRISPAISSSDIYAPARQAHSQTIYFSGSVMQEDGTPPPLGTVIELDCGDTTTREATADLSGRFQFQVGSNYRIGRVAPDAGDSISQDTYDTAANNRMLALTDSPSSSGIKPLSARLIGCELRAQHPGYRSISVRLRIGSVSGYNEVDPILIYQTSKVQGTSISLASLLAPKDVKKKTEQATKALQKRRFGEAGKLLNSALEAYPKSAEAWYLLGRIYQAQQDNKRARDSYRKAIDADSLYIRPYIQLGRIEAAERKWRSAADLTNKALELDPIAFPEAYYLNALALYSLADIDRAERSARTGARLDFNHQYPQIHLVLANVLAMKNDPQGSLAEMRKYLKIAPKGDDAAVVRSRLERQEKLVKSN